MVIIHSLTIQINEIITYIKEQYNTIDSIDALANHFGYSPFYFSRAFKKETGFSIKQFISSLKMEASINNLVIKNNSVLASHLKAGFLSATTFSKNFEKQTGVTPKQYQKSLKRLYAFMKDYEQIEKVSHSHYEKPAKQELNSQCIVTLDYPSYYKGGVSFIGLFKHPIPNHRPIVGKAVVGSQICVLDNIPPGNYYLLACSIEKNGRLSDYFVLNKALRCKIDDEIAFPKQNMAIFNLNFREALPEDPPININLPKLLFDDLK
ncbi:helix-turn-helix domain-containing protein [Streptococcus sp. CSL10205-OR2]|uniref:helix-turn-helix domain-containing protein n=1 Tax=Streptococcus sp. CSL10205-OR2 TaxID=2980558 RepID=UPI0021D8652B|nr:AraC family transcriptional regulator [Streptococcus sp. CSL10205-OR2]MCU9533243.1 AraC family transcriptional regulator [Streptococcus sp. CSL10205-OR2]